MNSFARFLAIVPVLFCTACSTITIKRDYDRNAKFSAYKTFAWAPPPNGQAPTTPAIDKAIRDAVEKSLTAKGITKGAKPDFYATYHVTAGQKTDLRYYTDWGFGTGYRPGIGNYAGWPGHPETYAVLDKTTVGMLILDFVEVRRQQLVWRSVATAVLGSGEQNATKAEEAVSSMLYKFPPPSVPPKP